MKYSKFTILNYKGIAKIELPLNSKPTSNIFTLVGLNESGKTSILEAIYLFHNGISKNQSHTLIPKSHQYSFTGSVSVSAKLELDESDNLRIKTMLEKDFHFILSEDILSISITKKYNFSKSTPLEGENWNQTTWSLDIKGKTKRAKKETDLHIWNNDAWQKTVSFITNNLLPKVLYYPDFLFKFPEKIYLKEFDKEGSEQAEYRSVIGDILESINTDLTVNDDLINRMENSTEKAHKDSLEQLLLKMSAKLNEEILEKWDTIFGSGQKKEVSINWGVDSSANPDGSTIDRYFLELKIKQGSDSYSINDRSLGFRWFFSFLIFTAFRKSRSSDPGETLFLLDEPASNLHQRSQQKLLQSLSEIVSNCKLIYSTHSHHMINPMWLSGTYIVKNEAINYGNPEGAKTSETIITATPYRNFVASYPNEVDHFKPILDALDYVPSKLEVVPYTIFTEGKNDYYTFKYFSEVIFANKYKLSFYPGAGVDKYEDVFRLYLAWNREFVALFDADSAGRNARNKYLKNIGPDMEEKVFTLDDVDNNWKNFTTEDLFITESEKNKITNMCFPERKESDRYDKSKFNTAIQELYLNGIKFGFGSRTLTKMEKIMRFLNHKVTDKKVKA